MDAYYSVVFYVLAGLFGVCIGSFLNVVIYRVPNQMSVAFPASHCPQCNTPIKWYDNIPILSYIMLGAKCRSCKKHIPIRYTIVEAVNMLLWLVCVWRYKDISPVYACICAVACSVCICVFFIDLENMIIPDRFQLILGGLAIIAVIIDGKEMLLSHILGCTIGFASFALIGFVAEKITKREALGGGDIKFVAVAGLFLGWQKLLLTVLLASLSASIIIIFARRKTEEIKETEESKEKKETEEIKDTQENKKTEESEESGEKEESKEYPFAPFLTAAFTLAMLFGDNIISWYISLIV